jgi:glycosyltransferase involved in cell wall biosynthesis
MTTDNTTPSTPLISVCVCTYHRPRQLEQLLRILDRQHTNGLFKLAIVVVDNDARQSARGVVESGAERSRVPIVYGVEQQQNIAVARNRSVAMTSGEFVAFVDDDEEPSSDWLCRLYGVLLEHAADGVLGPVLPKFEEGAPNWAVTGVKTRICSVELCHEDGCLCGLRTPYATKACLPNAHEWRFNFAGRCCEEKSRRAGLEAVGEGY